MTFSSGPGELISSPRNQWVQGPKASLCPFCRGLRLCLRGRWRGWAATGKPAHTGPWGRRSFHTHPLLFLRVSCPLLGRLFIEPLDCYSIEQALSSCWGFTLGVTALLSNRNRMQATCVALNFLVATLKEGKEIGEIIFDNLFYLSQDVKNIIILT